MRLGCQREIIRVCFKRRPDRFLKPVRSRLTNRRPELKFRPALTSRLKTDWIHTEDADFTRCFLTRCVLTELKSGYNMKESSFDLTFSERTERSLMVKKPRFLLRIHSSGNRQYDNLEEATTQ